MFSNSAPLLEWGPNTRCQISADAQAPVAPTLIGALYISDRKCTVYWLLDVHDVNETSSAGWANLVHNLELKD